MLDFEDLAWAPTRAFYVGLAERAGDLARELLYSDDRRRRERGLFEVAAWLPEVAARGGWRRQVLKQLGQITLNPHRPLLLRQRAIAALAQTGDEGVLVLLRQLLRRPELSLRQVAAAALVNFGPRRPGPRATPR
jgi:HEAT repeat protein